MISSARPRIAVNIAGLTSYVTLLVKVVEDLALHHTFDAVDQSTLVSTIVGIVYVLCIVSGVHVDGQTDVQSVVEPARDAATPAQAEPTSGTAS